MQKKILIFTFILLLNISSVYSIRKPSKFIKVGAIVGKAYVESNNSWDFILYFKNEKTGKEYTIKPLKRNNYFYHLSNLNPGVYSLYKFSLNRIYGNYHQWASHLLSDQYKIDIIVEPDKITPVDFLKITIMLTRYSVSINDINIDDYLSDLKSYFNEVDKKGFWKDFKWNDLSMRQETVL